MSQTLAKTQAARETEKVKEKIRLKKIKDAKEKSDPGEVIQPFGENMDKIKESRSKGKERTLKEEFENDPIDMKNLKQVIEFFEGANRPNQRLLKDAKNLKSGGQVKCGVQMKGTSPLIKKRKGK